MFDVYLNEKRDRLLVIARGQPIPAIENAGRWRKKKATATVSDEIKSNVQRDGFYWRKLRKSNSLQSKKPTATPSDLVETISELRTRMLVNLEFDTIVEDPGPRFQEPTRPTSDYSLQSVHRRL